MATIVGEPTEGNALTDTYVLWRRQVKRFFNNPLKLVAMLIRPLIWLGLFGLTMSSVTGKVGRHPYVVYILPGIVAMSVLSMATKGGQTLLKDKMSGFLKEVLVAPVSRTSILFGFCLGITTRSLVNAFLTIAAGFLIGATLGDGLVESIEHLLLLITILSLLSLALVSLSCALAWLIDDIVTYGTISGWFFYPLLFLSGSLYKIKGLPTFLVLLIQLNPLTYGVDAVRYVLVGPDAATYSFGFDLIFTGCFAFLCTGLALWVMTRRATGE